MSWLGGLLLILILLLTPSTTEHSLEPVCERRVERVHLFLRLASSCVRRACAPTRQRHLVLRIQTFTHQVRKTCRVRRCCRSRRHRIRLIRIRCPRSCLRASSCYVGSLSDGGPSEADIRTIAQCDDRLLDVWEYVRLCTYERGVERFQCGSERCASVCGDVACTCWLLSGRGQRCAVLLVESRVDLCLGGGGVRGCGAREAADKVTERGEERIEVDGQR